MDSNSLRVFNSANRRFITFMAIDEGGYTTNVPRLEPIDKEDKLLETVAIRVREFAKKLDSDCEETLGWR